MSDQRPTPETDALAKAWRDRDSSNGNECPKSFRELAWELEQQRDEAREIAQELRDALYAVYNLPPNCSCAIGNNEMGVWHDVGIVLGKAKEVLEP